MGNFDELKISNSLNITHLLFINDILLFYDGSETDTENLAKILKLFEKATDMLVNINKSNITPVIMEDLEIRMYSTLFHFILKILDEGLK